eukprot:s27_g44.t1
MRFDTMPIAIFHSAAVALKPQGMTDWLKRSGQRSSQKLSSMATKPSRNRPSWADLFDSDDEHEKSSMATKPSCNRPSWADLFDSDDEHEKKPDPGYVPDIHQEALQATAEVPKVDREDAQVHDKKGEKDKGWPQKLAYRPRFLQTVPQSSAVVNTKTAETPSHAEFQESSSHVGPLADMWIFEKPDPEIHVEAWLSRGPLVMKKGEKMYLWRATVRPRDRKASLCAKCQQPCSHHHQDCKYMGQIPCGWCNRPPCKHAAEGQCTHKQCSRKNFGCNFCHYGTSGHCIPNQSDVQKCNIPWPWQ